MTPEEAGSVTRIIGDLKAGADEAVGELWERYSRRLVGLARERLRGVPRGAADEEDVALSAFDSFCTRAARGQFPDMEDREGLWRLVARITARKAIDLVQEAGRVKRGGGRVFGHRERDDADDQGADRLAKVADPDPTPEFAAVMADECRRLLDGLADDTLRRIALWKVDGHTDEEIAALLDCSRRTVARKLELIRGKWSGELTR